MFNALLARRCLAIILLSGFVAPHLGVAQSADPTGLAEVSVSSSLRQVFSLAVGATRHASITLANSGAEAAQVSLSQIDMTFTPEGEMVYAAANSTAASNAAWIDVPAQVVVPAHSTVEVPLTIRVPEQAGVISGSYWSMLQIEPLKPRRVDTDSAEGRVHTSVNVTFQYVMIVLTHVGVPAESLVQFTQPAFDLTEAGSHQLEVGLHNPGTFVVEAETWLELYDSEGTLVEAIEGKTARPYPGFSQRLSFDLGELQAEAYQAVVIANAGRGRVFGTRYNLDLTAR